MTAEIPGIAQRQYMTDVRTYCLQEDLEKEERDVSAFYNENTGVWGITWKRKSGEEMSPAEFVAKTKELADQLKTTEQLVPDRHIDLLPKLLIELAGDYEQHFTLEDFKSLSDFGDLDGLLVRVDYDKASFSWEGDRIIAASALNLPPNFKAFISQTADPSVNVDFAETFIEHVGPIAQRRQTELALQN